MSFKNIMDSMSNPKIPPDNVLECLSKLIVNIQPSRKIKVLTPSQELCKIFNKISSKNIGSLLPKCKDILLKHNIEYNTIQKLVDIISSQPLHLDTYSTIICTFSKDQTDLLFKCLFSQDSPKKIINIASFYALWCIKSKNTPDWNTMYPIKDNYNFSVPFTIKLLEKTQCLPKTDAGKEFLKSLLEFINENINQIELNIRMISYDLIDLHNFIKSKRSLNAKKS